jgi:Aminoglycoside-2''-adenylyltransferase
MQLTAELLAQQLQLADILLVGRYQMLEPQDLPGRYGRVVRALDQVLGACNCEAVVGGGWAVWRHGYVGRVTQDIDIALPSDRIDEFLKAASVNGFEILAMISGNWPKLWHRETGIEVDVLPEGGRPGTAARPAPTTIPHPNAMGATRGMLKYIALPSLIELKLAAGRLRDEADVVELARENRDRLDEVRRHLQQVHAEYAKRFDELVAQANESAGG